MKRTILLIMILFIISAPAWAGHFAKEQVYQKQWCSECGGVIEYVLPDRTRVDCLTDQYAIEFDFAPKWAEAIGQSLYYALMTKRKPGIVLIIESPGDSRYVKRLRTVADKYGIRVWLMPREDLR